MNEELSQRPILLVEDNPVDVDLTLRAFSRRKLVNRIEVARDGEEALLDLKLPRVDGLEGLRRYRATPVCADLPVVVLTTSSDNNDVKTAYAHHANSYIVKPVDFDKFMEVATQIELYWCLINRPSE